MIPSKFRKKLGLLKNSLVIQNLILVSGITFLIKGLGFFKETVVAANFGMSEMLDTFYIAILVPTFINVVFLGPYRGAFIPNYIAELKSKGNIASFQTSSFLITLLVSVFFIGIAYITTDVYLDILFPGHTEAYYDLIKEQFHVLLPCVVFWGLASLIGGLLNVANEYRWSTSSGVFTPIAILICLYFFKDTLGAKVLAVGTLAGAISGLLYLLIVAHYKRIFLLGLPDFKNANIQKLFAQLPAKLSSAVMTSLNSMVDQFFAAQLVAGSIAALNYGLKIPAFLISLLVVAISNVMLPHFSKAILEDRKNAFRTLFSSMRVVFIGGSIFVIIGIVFSHDLVSLLFERQAFTPEDTNNVAQIQQIYLIYVPFTIAGMILSNFLTSINKNAIQAYIAFVSLILNIILDYIFMKYYGVFGIALCTTVVVIIKNLGMFTYIYRLKKNTIR